MADLGKRQILNAIVALAMVAAAVPATVRNLRPASTFVMKERKPAPPAAASFSSEFLPFIKGLSVHSATLAELSNGDLIAAWYGGSDEAVADVRIFTSRCDHATGKWSPPQVLQTREEAEKSLRMHVKSIGNPVLLADEHGVSLFFVSILFGGWSG